MLALPRCRTAWLSVLLTGRDSFCFHEGTGAFADWPAYVAALRARPEGSVGDSSPALVEHIDALLAEFPDARFVVVRRDPAEALESFCAAAPESAETIRAGWNAYMAAFESAVAKLPAHLAVDFRELSSETTCDSIHRHLLDAPMDRQRWRQLSALHITSRFPPVHDWSARSPLVVEVNVEGFDFSGLSVRAYTATDREMVATWWAEHRESPMGALPLPPLGIIVEDESGPVGALWCFETFGTGVAWIEVPVTRPGLCYERASVVMAFAVLAITQLAGAGHEPRGEFTRFRVCCPPPMARLLKRLGFMELPQRSNLLLALTI